MRVLRLRVILLGIAILLSYTRPALAAPIASIEYLETSLGVGRFQYDYTIHNIGDPADLYWLTFFVSPETALVSAATPANWDLISGPGFIDTFSLLPGAAPIGADIGPEQTLSGFSFVFDNRVGSTAFQALFANVIDPLNPLVAAGTTAETVAPQQVPEPSTLMLLGSAIGTFLAARRRIRPYATDPALVRRGWTKLGQPPGR